MDSGRTFCLSGEDPKPVHHSDWAPEHLSPVVPLPCQRPLDMQNQVQDRLPALQWLMLASCPSARPAFCLAEHLHSADPCWWIAFDHNSRSPLREQPWAQLQGQVSPRCPWVCLSSELSLCSVPLSQAAGMTLYLWESTFPNAGLFLIQKAW